MTRPSSWSRDAITVPRHRSDDWRIDDAGVLHVGDAAPFVDRVVVTPDGGGVRS
jgi:hypothetical protein